jgi:rhamnosyltransferase
VAESGAAPILQRTDLCAVVVTYFPDTGCGENLTALAGQVDCLVIIDNGSSEESLRPVVEAARRLSATLVRLGANLGVAAALNVGIRFARERGYHWLATFDQDSRATPTMIETMAATLARYPQADRVAVISPRHVDRLIGFTVRERGAEAKGIGWRVIPSVMTSGNLVRLDAAIAVGGFDERLFIDYVDHDFCLKLRRRGFRVLQATAAQLLHSLGSMERRLVLVKRINVTHHGAVRRYYISRNRLVLWQRYWRQEPVWVSRDVRRFFSEAVYMLLFEREVSKKLRMMARGIRDALNGRLGPCASGSLES